jgi:hypothetical protein
MDLEEMLRNNQRMLADCAGLLRRLHELSVAIAESQQSQLERHDGILQRLAEGQMATDRHLDRLAEAQRVLTESERHLVESQLAIDQRLDRLAESQQALVDGQAALDQRLDRMAEFGQASDRRLDRVIEILERFLRGQTGNGHGPT